MNPGLIGHPDLIFIKANAADVSFPNNSFDILTCDMSWDPIRTAKMVCRLAPSVRKNGILIITIKLMHKKILQTIDEFIRIQKPECEPIGIKQLFHNRDWVTAYLRKK